MMQKTKRQLARGVGQAPVARSIRVARFLAIRPSGYANTAEPAPALDTAEPPGGEPARINDSAPVPTGLGLNLLEADRS